MVRRLQLHEELVEVLGSRNVYYQPPESKKLSYPCIMYSMSDIVTEYADNTIYKKLKRYDIVVIDRDPDSDIADKLLEHFKYCSYDRSYSADNLHHFVCTLFY